MKREQIEKEFNVINGRITTLGRFEGEPVYAPYFWDAYLNGCWDDEIGGTLIYDVTAEDKEQFPELLGMVRVGLFVRDDGFIICGDAEGLEPEDLTEEDIHS